MTQTLIIEVLQASKPVPELAEKLQLFGQFVGSWNARVINYKPDGSSLIVEADFHTAQSTQIFVGQIEFDVFGKIVEAVFDCL